MRDQKSKLVTREDLYLQVWETPISKLATQYGITDRGLSKICKRLNVPTPGRGYWARKLAGKHVIQYQLPHPNKKTPHDVVITEHGGLLQPSPDIQNSLSKTIKEAAPFSIPERLTSPHPIIKKWLDEYKRRKREEKEDKRRDPFGPDFSSLYKVPSLTPVDRLRYRILHVLFKELEKQGYEIKSERHESPYLEYDGIRVDFVLREKLKQLRRPLTDEEKTSIFTRDKSYIQELVPTGKLHFSIKTYLERGLRQEWNETDKKSLENHFPSILATFKLAGPLLVENKRQREEEEEERRQR